MRFMGGTLGNIGASGKNKPLFWANTYPSSRPGRTVFPLSQGCFGPAFCFGFCNILVPFTNILLRRRPSIALFLVIVFNFDEQGYGGVWGHSGETVPFNVDI